MGCPTDGRARVRKDSDLDEGAATAANGAAHSDREDDRVGLNLDGVRVGDPGGHVVRPRSRGGAARNEPEAVGGMYAICSLVVVLVVDQENPVRGFTHVRPGVVRFR